MSYPETSNFKAVTKTLTGSIEGMVLGISLILCIILSITHTVCYFIHGNEYGRIAWHLLAEILVYGFVLAALFMRMRLLHLISGACSALLIVYLILANYCLGLEWWSYLATILYLKMFFFLAMGGCLIWMYLKPRDENGLPAPVGSYSFK